MNRLTLRLFLFFLIALAGKLRAQEIPLEPVIGQVTYQFIHVNDTTKRDNPREEEMILYIGAKSSFYTSNGGAVVNRQLREQIADPAFDGNLTISSKGKGTNESFYFRPTSRILKKTYRLLQQQYIVDEPYPQLHWQIRSDTSIIGGYRCQKAIVSFKGRTYTAWFSPDLPFPFGPWKLQGLPGLILEAKDSRNEVIFRYSGFDKVSNPEIRIGSMEGYLQTDQRALDRLITAFQNNPQAFRNAQGSGGLSAAATVVTGVSSENKLNDGIDPNRIKSITVRTDAGGVSNTDNNPLELPE